MADARDCGRTDPHQFHGWTEEAPDAPHGKQFHVCSGVPDSDRVALLTKGQDA